MGETVYRGTTKDNYGFIRRSHLADGKMETMWWGEILDPDDPPWVVIEFPEKMNLDSLQIDWGELRPKSFEFAYWTEDYAEYPGVHQALENKLKTESVVKVNSETTKYKFKQIRTRYVAIRFKTQELPSKGVQIREMKLYSGEMDLLAGNSYKFYAMSTRNGDIARTDWTDIKWDFEAFMDYIKTLPNAKAVICVNAGTGTSKEAAAWVRYANKVKGYNIKQWQIGNELDGEWEESGPISARHYAARFLEYARAMKAVDSTILLHGPLFSTHKMLQKGAGLLDGKYWMEEFLRIVGEAEKKDGKRYLDVVDLHNYPYWTPNEPKPAEMLKAMLDVGPNMDTLDVWMKRHLDGERRVSLSEFSTCVQGFSLLMDYPQAAAVASIFAQHAVRFGNRLQVLPWDAFGNLFKGPDDTWGTISMTALVKEGSWNHCAKSTSPDVEAYAIGKGDSTRVLLVNLSEVPQVVQIDRESVTAAGNAAEVGKGDLVRTQVDVFGEEQFKWVGTWQNSYPYPKMGPSGRRINPSKSKDITVGDTIDLFVTAVQQDGQLTNGVVTIGNWGKRGMFMTTVEPDDGKWNASIESFHVKVPIPEDIYNAPRTIRVTVWGLGGKTAVMDIPFRVRGAYRTTMAMQNFDNGLDAVDWYPVANGDNATTIGAKVFNGAPPHGGFIRHDFLIEQPPAQGWPNFAGAYYVIPEEVKKSVGIVFDYATNHNNPDGYFEVQIASSQVEDYDEFMVRLKNTRGSWVRDTLIWENMKQEGWGKTVPQLDPTRIKNFAFRARHSGMGYISLDNIYLLGEDGEEIPMPRGLRRLR